MSTLVAIATLVGTLTSVYSLAIMIRNARMSARRDRAIQAVIRQNLDHGNPDHIIHRAVHQIGIEYWDSVRTHPIKALFVRSAERRVSAEAPAWALRLLGSREALKRAR